MASFIFLESPSPTPSLPNLPMPLSSPPAPAHTLMDCSTCLSPPYCSLSDYCRTFCVEIYLDPLDCSPKSHKFHPSLLLALLLLSLAFLLVSSFALYLRYSCNRRFSTSTHGSRSLPSTGDQFLDMDVEPILDHPVWYINTVGLRPSVITSITVCSYKKGDGLVEGTDCSICLNEFRDGETLRLLPKCSHAFHIPCIDTWLLSHTSCPMCRAGIVFGSGRVSVSDIVMEIPQDGRDDDLSQHEVVFSEIPDSLEEGIGHVNGNRRGGSRNIKEVGNNGVKIVRRSVSMDCMSTSRLCPPFANLTHLESSSLSSSANSTADTRGEEFPMGNGKKGAACSQRFRDCYFMESMQRPGPSLMTRSSSCGAKLFLQRYGRS